MATTNADVALFTIPPVSSAFRLVLKQALAADGTFAYQLRKKARITREPRVSLSGAYQAWVPPQCGQPTDVETGASNT